METLTFECEIITPMFMYGGDGYTLELRPSEFKGMLRFWWRAIHPNLSLKELKERENEIFGSTNRKSGFRIVVEEIEVKKNTNENLKDYLDKNKLIGVRYLLYSNFFRDNLEKRYFLPNSKFRITFLLKNKNYKDEILKAFWLLVNLGGLGSRSRRGGGNIFATPKNFNTNLIFNIQSFEDFITTLNTILPLKNKNKDFINLGNFELFVSTKTFTSWEDTLNSIGYKLMNFRNIRNPDYTLVKNYIQKGFINKPVERTAFGLPLSFRYRSLRGASALLEGSNKERQRSGSPLFIKVLKLKEGYKYILLFFKKDLLKTGDKVKISTRDKKPKYLNVPSLKIINEFLQELENKYEAKRVI
jgi:CRISPR-associated protein Cmr1